MRLTSSGKGSAFVGSPINARLNREVIDLPISLHEGTNGTMLGRCDRTKLYWPSGPWDSEPDVVAWQFKDLMPVLRRAIDGKWMAMVFGISNDRPESKAMTHGEIAELTGIRRMRLGQQFTNLEEVGLVGLEDYVVGLGLEVGRSCMTIMPPDHSQSPTEDLQSGQSYCTAADMLSETGRVLKALNLDERLRQGTDWAWAFDNAEQVRPSSTKRFSRLDVEDVIAELQVVPGVSVMASKTWNGLYILHRYEQPASNVIIETGVILDSAMLLMPQASEFISKIETYLIENRLMPSSDIDAIDVRMQAELDSIARELR